MKVNPPHLLGSYTFLYLLQSVLRVCTQLSKHPEVLIYMVFFSPLMLRLDLYTARQVFEEKKKFQHKRIK